MDKYADDKYAMMPTSNSMPCADEITNIENGAQLNNLNLNRTKSAQIVFVAPRSRRVIVIPPPAILEIPRVKEMKVLGVVLSSITSVKRFLS